MMMTQIVTQTQADCGAAIEIVPVRGELDLATADSLGEQGHAAIARHPWLLLLDLTGLSFCDARGLARSSGSPTRLTRQGAVMASSARSLRWRRCCGSAD